MAISRLILALLLSLCISYVFGHSYVTSPTSRSNQKSSNAGCRGPNCLGPCDVPLNYASRTPAVSIARGGSINVQWPRNNHAGGFIRFAWSKTSDSDSHASFDANVQEFHCHEIGGCGPDNANDLNGGDSGPADGSSRACQASIQVPLHLSDGEWTLQWAWFGGAFALGDYFSCVDYKINGGPSAPKTEALFYGGDITYPNQPKCKFFNTDRLHACVNEPCNNPVYTMYKEQSGAPYGVVSAGQKPITPQGSTSTSGAPKTITTASKPSLTTGAKPPVSVTSSRISTASIPSVPSTTGRVVPSEIPKNCAGLSNLVDASAVDLTITAVDTWNKNFRLEVQMDIHTDISDWMLQIIWPAEAVDTQIEQVYNAGELRCSASVPTRHEMIQPVAKWANNLKAGEQMFIEVKATNTNMSKDFIKANTRVRMFKKF